jgi:glycosyltransferase involved in cell wall biosynthesis
MPHNEFLAGPGVPGLVSIVIPTYNRREYIAAALDSALSQTYPNLEAIVVDDGSTDDTKSEVARYTDPRVKYFFKKNEGVAVARNFALGRATGEFIAFLDSDDIWLPWKLEAQMELFRRHPEVGLVWTDMSTFEKPGELLERRFLRTYYQAYNEVDIEKVCARIGTVRDLSAKAPAEWQDAPYLVGDLFTQLFLGNLIHPPTAIIRRERFRQAGGFEPEITGVGGEDHHLYLRICEHGPVALLDAPTILYRLHPTQISRAHSLEYARSDVRVLNHWLKRRPPALPRAAIRQRVAAAHLWAGNEELHSGDRSRATAHFWNSFIADPRQIRVGAMVLLSVFPRSVLSALRAAKRLLRNAGSAEARALFWSIAAHQTLITPDLL